MADNFWDPAGDEPVAASRLNNGAVFSANDVTDLKTVDTTDCPNGEKYITDDNGNLYIFDSGSSATPDDYNVVQPTVGGGRFILKSSGGSVSTITASQTAVNNARYILNSSGRIYVALPASSTAGNILELSARNNGGWLLKPGSGQTIFFGDTSITGTDYAIEGINYASIKIQCVNTNQWSVLSYVGTLTAGLIVYPLIQSTDFAQTLTAGTTSQTDITDSLITYVGTAGNRALFGFNANFQHNDVVDNSIDAQWRINGTNDTDRAHFYAGLKAILSSHYLVTSLTAGTKTTRLQAQTSAGNALTITSGVMWGIEITSGAAADTTVVTGNFNNSSTSYTDVTSTAITISPTNNPVLLLFTSKMQAASFPTAHMFLKMTDSTNDYGEWLNGYDQNSSPTNTLAWVTGDLNGSTTFKVQYKSSAAFSANLTNRWLTAIELTGDVKRAIPSGTCNVTDSEATITDGSTPLSHAFTPGANIQYVCVFTGYLERTA